MKKLLPFLAALFIIAAVILGTAFLAGSEVRSFTSFEGAEQVFAVSETEPII